MPGCVGPFLYPIIMVDFCHEPDALCSPCPGWACPAAGCRRHSQLLQTLTSALHCAAADENSFGYPRPPWRARHHPTLNIPKQQHESHYHIPYHLHSSNPILYVFSSYHILNVLPSWINIFQFSISISILLQMEVSFPLSNLVWAFLLVGVCHFHLIPSPILVMYFN